MEFTSIYKSLGTLHQASGNHYIGRPPNYTLIYDDTKVKDVLMLKCPTDAPKNLEHLFNYQFTVLNNIRIADEQQELDNNQDNVDALEWLRHSNPDAAPNLICIYCGPKYIVPDGSVTTSVNRKRPRGKQTSRISVSAPLTSLQPANDGPTPNIPDQNDIKLGASYDPHLLPDYGGPLFKHKQAKLKQRNFVDINNNLIPPWEEYDKLRTGTVVLMRVTLHTFTIATGNKEKKIYQIYADRAKVVATSNEDVHERTMRFVEPNTDDFVQEEHHDDEEQLKCFDEKPDTEDTLEPSSSAPPTHKTNKKTHGSGGVTTRASGKGKNPEGKLAAEMIID